MLGGILGRLLGLLQPGQHSGPDSLGVHVNSHAHFRGLGTEHTEVLAQQLQGLELVMQPDPEPVSVAREFLDRAQPIHIDLVHRLDPYSSPVPCDEVCWHGECYPYATAEHLGGSGGSTWSELCWPSCGHLYAPTVELLQWVTRGRICRIGRSRRVTMAVTFAAPFLDL